MATTRRAWPSAGNDSGAADDRLAAALAAYAEDPARRPDVLAALHVARVLAPIVTVPGEVGAGAKGLTVDKSADISVPLLGGSDGRLALPVFSGLAPMARWDPKARPVPVDGPGAAGVAAAEQAEVLVVDVAGPATCVLDAAELRALADGRGRVPAYDDEALASRVGQLLEPIPAVAAAWLLPQQGVDARLALRLTGETRAADVRPVLEQVARVLRDLPGRDAAGVHGLDVALVLPDQPPERPPVYRAPA